MTVEDFIDDSLTTSTRRPALLALSWLRKNPDALDTIKEVYAEGAKGNSDAFREFAAVVWTELNADSDGMLDALDIAPDDERNWISTLALVVGAWGFMEMGQRG